MQRTPLVHADERRLATILAHRAAVVVEAPAGFGKSRLLRLLDAATPDPHLITDPADLAALAAEATTLADGAVVLIDLLDPEPAAIATIAEQPTVEMVVVAGRIVSRAVRDVLGAYPCLELTAADLALTETEISAMLGGETSSPPPTTIELIAGQTAGWPAAVEALASHRRASRTSPFDDPAIIRRGLVHHPVIDRTVRETLAALPTDLATGVTRFGLLERFTASAFDAVTRPGAIRDLVAHGVPLLEDADGWLHLPPVMRQHLGGDIDPDDAERIAPHLAQSGGLLPAAHALVASGSLHGAANLIVSTPRAALDDVEPRAVIGLLNAISPVGDPVALGLVRARAHENLGELRDAEAIVDELVASIDPADAGWTNARLEQLRNEATRGEHLTTLDDPRLQLTTPEHHTRRREVAGLRAAQSSDPAEVERSIGLLETAAGEWQALGDVNRAAAVLRAMSSIALIHLGRYPDAIDAATRARRLCWNRLYDRALSTVLLVRLAGLAGRPDLIEREAAAAESLAEAVRLPWLDHHIAVAMAYGAVFTDRPGDAVDWANRAEHTLGVLAEHSTATVFHAEMAQALAMVGQTAASDHHLARTEARNDNPLEARLASASISARRGDTVRARELLDDLENDDTIPATRLWRPQLELALAANDRPLADESRAIAHMLGLGELADRLSTPDDAAISIRVLGCLSITRAGAPVTPPTGKPAELLTLLVCRGGSVTVDQAIDALWGEDVTSTDQGTRRLKNPVNRLREAIGADAIVRTSAAIHLAPSVDTDLAHFDEAARWVSGLGCGREAAAAAVDALNLYEPLLPDEPHSELTANRSVDLVATASGLFDLVLRQPDPDRPSSSWLLDTARRIDLYAEPWFTTIARLAIRENNLVFARQALALARASAVELDLPDNPEVDALTAQLAIDA